MKIGMCCGTDVEKYEKCKEMGYDFVESNCGGIASMSDDEFEIHLAKVKETGIPVLTANCFLPGETKVSDPESDDKITSDYLSVLLPRAKRIGIDTIVFGSGGARRIPEGVSPEQGRATLVRKLREIICPMAAEYGILIAIEPLRYEESNILNSVHEAVEVMNEVGHKNLKVLADLYHMVCVEEEFEYLSGLEGVLVHTHTSNPYDSEHKRIFPLEGDGYDQKPFLKNVFAAGCERCAVEAGCSDFDSQAPQSLKVLADALKEIGA